MKEKPRRKNDIPADKKGAATPSWPASAVEHWPVSRLRPFERNPRTHSDDQIAQIARAIEHWGWTVPVLADESGKILAGHARVAAAKSLGLMQAPVIVARGWSEEQKRAYVIADNRLAEASAWDEGLLSLELGDLVDAGFDLALLGMSEQEVHRSDRGIDGGSLKVREVMTSPVNDEFWISVRGPLAHQADALMRLREAMQGLDGVAVELGVISTEP